MWSISLFHILLKLKPKRLISVEELLHGQAVVERCPACYLTYLGDVKSAARLREIGTLTARLHSLLSFIAEAGGHFIQAGTWLSILDPLGRLLVVARRLRE